MKKGKLISFEGIEGVGKTTTINSIKKYLESYGVNVYSTREPGGTKCGESLRNILLNNKTIISPEAELLLLFAIRKQHIDEIIKDKLSLGTWVLCDRYIDASIAYQGYGKKVSLKKIKILIENFTDNITPDLTIFFDLPYSLSKKRFPKNKKKDRFENLNNKFFNDVYDGYVSIANNNKKRIKRVDANCSKEDVFSQITSIIDTKFKHDLIL
jgi:dTMP kinase|tara:strand:+ start:24017 stop:24652 length:636 start_codon:yes stop_codon:yes gene_type:complete